MNSALVVFEPILDSNGFLLDAKCVDLNPSSEILIGYKKEEVIGKTLFDVFPNTDQLWLDKFAHVVKNKQVLGFESVHTPLGKYFSVNAFPVENDMFAVSFFDISDQEKLKEKLGDSEKRYKTVFYDSHSVMLLINPRDKTIVDANSAAISFYGYSKSELIGMSMRKINEMSDADLAFEMNLATQQKKNHFLLKHRLASGEVRDVEVYSGAIIANGQTLLHSVIHDVTENFIALEEVNRLSMAVDQSPVSVVITDTYGDILYCNPKHCELTGYFSEEMVGQNPRILKSGKFTKEAYRNLWETITAGKKWSGEFFNKKKDGSFYWELAFIAPIKSDKGEIVNYIKAFIQ